MKEKRVFTVDLRLPLQSEAVKRMHSYLLPRDLLLSVSHADLSHAVFPKVTQRCLPHALSDSKDVPILYPEPNSHHWTLVEMGQSAAGSISRNLRTCHSSWRFTPIHTQSKSCSLCPTLKSGSWWLVNSRNALKHHLAQVYVLRSDSFLENFTARLKAFTWKSRGTWAIKQAGSVKRMCLDR